MTFRPKRRELLVGAGAASLGGLAGCLSDVPGFESEVGAADSVGGTDRTLRLGIMSPLSGELESFGETTRDAALLPIEQFEDEVSLDIDYTVVDTETAPSAGVQSAAALVDDGYPMVNGPLASDVTLQATQQMLIPYRVVNCSPGATSPTITSVNDAGLVFRTALSDSLQALVLAEQAVTDLGTERAAVLYVDNDYGWQLTQAFSQAFETDHGATVTAEVPVTEGADSYDNVIETAMADNPELLIVVGYPDTGEQLFDDLAATGARDDVEVLVTEGMQAGALHESTDSSLDGIRGTAPIASGPGYETFSEQYESAYGESPGLFTAHAYDATAALLLANAYAGQNEGTAIRNAMQAVTYSPGTTITPENLDEGLELAAQGENVAYEGASSSVTFDQHGDVRGSSFSYWEFDESADGGITELDRVSV
ncbi:extracellular ligand-binding receptor [Natrialba chahannaoensis JCM 10990]|uniref:Extracellular ligand-binding receptor n=1 Tax=Natrialba chahannaoensis JCM 10990 TaxID=1227492 RepID=M0ARU6_9EURY|nr:ABC transporter substrate-binding protein [Natrialba chahannaoensis]ELZ01441.1 extracellular ligand-binding receptor [Natrialba chahannaoensis JCM 10990]